MAPESSLEQPDRAAIAMASTRVVHIAFRVYDNNGSMLNTVGVNKKFHIYTMTNSQDIFAIALGLEEPWHIKEIAFDRDSSRLDIHLGFTKGFKFKAGDGLFYSAHDTVKRSWQHLNFFQHHCYIHAKVPRIK